MSFQAAFAVFCIALALGGCGPHVDNSQVHLSAPAENTTLGPGDVFTVQIVGEKDLPTDYQVAADGTIDFPYIHRVNVDGLEPQEIVTLLEQRLIREKVLTDPSLVLEVKEYNSKHVTVMGQIQKPGSLPFTPGLTLIQALSSAGGFSAIAKRSQVSLSRKTKSGTETVMLNVDAIIDGQSPDVPLQAGDQIYVHERVF